MKLKPETRKEKLTVAAVVFGVIGGFTTTGGAVLMWEQLRPWMSDQEKLEQHNRSCEAMIWTIETDLLRAQTNEIESNERATRLVDPEAKELNRKLAAQAMQSQIIFERKLERTKEECKEGREKWD